MASAPSASSIASDASLDPDGDSVLLDSAPLGSPRTAPGDFNSPRPMVPLCTFGTRLAFTYFSKNGLPTADQLNVGNEEEFWFSVDDQLLYLSFFQDSGPLNAGCLYRFCLHVHTLLEDQAHAGKRIILYSSDEADKKANAAVLMVLYALVVMRWSPPDVLHPVASLQLQPFRDAGYSLPTYHLSLQSMVFGVQRALSLNLLDFSTFDLVAYETFEKVEMGDWNWLTPGFVAFASPVEPGYVARLAAGHEDGRSDAMADYTGKRLSRAFRNVLEEFEKGGVRVIVRLNKKLYDKTHFTERGIEHREMYFDDGTNPSMEMCREFIDLSDRIISQGGVVAVHCKAGLGRTGTLIGAYLIYKHGFTADEAIAFMRLMRPGSCVGPQQHFLYENQMTWVRWAAQDEARREWARERRDERVTLDKAASRAERALAAQSTTPPRQRALTPENNGTQGVPPRTPSRNQAVPGQPRKTPGKSRHGVAEPEVQHAEDERERELALERESLMLVAGDDNNTPEEERQVAQELTGAKKEPVNVTPPPPKVTLESASPDKPTRAPVHAGRTAGRVPAGGSSRIRSQSQGGTLAPAASITTSTSTPGGRTTTRIARARPTPTGPRPLSALADNRMVDRVGGQRTVSGGAPGSGAGSGASATAAGADFRRSKAVKDLSLFEGAGQRYALRGAATSAEGAGEAAPSLGPPPPSPSRLPTRVPMKRGKVTTLGGVGKPGSGGGNEDMLRKVRRRRSSLGETDFAASR